MIKFEFYKTYLAAIKNSVGSKLFQNLYLNMDGKETDAADGGEYSCTIFVSWILKIFSSNELNIRLIKEAHATVDSGVVDLLDCGWQETTELKPGAIVLWPEHETKRGIHKHLGFYIGDQKVISHRDSALSPIEHDLDDPKLGQHEKIFWHPNLDS